MVFIDILRRFKWSYSIYNLFQKKHLAHNIPLYEKYGINKKYYDSISSNDFKDLDEEINWLDEGNAREELPKNETFQELNPSFQNSLLSWSENGYAILEGFYDKNTVAKTNEIIDEFLSDGTLKWRFNNKLMFAIHHDDFLLDLGINNRIKGVLELLLGRKVKLFQSINFYKGSQQETHSDSIHMTTFPKGNLIAVWIALEDITADAGPLHFYPGSHKLDYVMNPEYNNQGNKWTIGDKLYKDYEKKIAKVLEAETYPRKQFLAKAGDILIWHANLLHGGDQQLNPDVTRKSMVLHYYAEDVICYHEISQRPAILKIK